jgi:hypothetical protein
VKGGRVSPHRIASYRIVSRRIASQRSAAHHNIPSTYQATACTPPHPTARPVSYSTMSLAPRSQTPCRLAGRIDGTAQNRGLDSFLPTRQIPCKSRATSRYPFFFFFSTTKPSAGKHSVGTERLHRSLRTSHHLISPQPITQSINQSINKLHIQCIHCHIPSTHPSSAVHIVRTLRLCDVMRCKLQFSMV